MSNEDERKLFVAGLPDSMSEDVLRQLFEATGGTVVNVTLPKHRDTGRPRGFGFVTMSSGEQAVSARNALDGSLQEGRSISVRPFSSDPPKRDPNTAGSGVASSSAGGNTGDRTLYVGNLPYDCSQQELQTLFNEAGVTPVVRIHLPVGPDGRMRGFGFVTMGSAEAANAAIVGLRGVEMRGRGLMVNIAHPRGERPAGGGGGGFGGPPSARGGYGGGGGGGYGPDFPPAPAPDAGRDRRAGGWAESENATPKQKKDKKKRAKLEPTRGRETSRDLKEKDWDDD